MARFIITTASSPFGLDGQPRPEISVETSKRELKAVRHARRIRATGNDNVMLFRHDEKKGWVPISLKYRSYSEGRHHRETGFNTNYVGLPVQQEMYRSLSGRIYKLADFIEGNRR